MAWFRYEGITPAKHELHGDRAVHRDCMGDHYEAGLPSGVHLVRTSTLDPTATCDVCGQSVAQHYADCSRLALPGKLWSRVLDDVERAALAGQLAQTAASAGKLGHHHRLLLTDRLIDLGESARVLAARRDAQREIGFVPAPQIAALVVLAQLDGAVDEWITHPDAAQALHLTCQILSNPLLQEPR